MPSHCWRTAWGSDPASAKSSAADPPGDPDPCARGLEPGPVVHVPEPVTAEPVTAESVTAERATAERATAERAT